MKMGTYSFLFTNGYFTKMQSVQVFKISIMIEFLVPVLTLNRAVYD